MIPRSFLTILITLILVLGSPLAAAGLPLPANAPTAEPIGAHTGYLKETGTRLSPEGAIAAWRDGRFSNSTTPVLNFGIDLDPVWIHFQVNNPTDQSLSRRLSIDTAWLDRVEVYFRHTGHTVAEYHTGDAQPFDQRPIAARGFVFDQAFAPGVTEVYLRVATQDPMVIPIRLLSPEQAVAASRFENYSYGFLYGFLVALMGYNLMLYMGLRERKYLLYALYLSMFLAMNLSYTGHGYQWLWPQLPGWAQWSNPVLMLAYGTTGLLFAQSFLETRHYLPRLHKGVLGFLGVSWAGLVSAIALGNQHVALLTAFSFVCLFTLIMLGLGILAVRSGQKPARYFLLAAIAAMLGAATTALAVWGFIPTNTWTYRAVDIGMLLDATLLALALTFQFRIGQLDKLRAEQLAWQDPLTGLNNRRAFHDKTLPIWNISLRHRHRLAVVLMDIDCFKRINDAYGHTYGDEVLVATADVLTATVREQDVIARWGGEEFILLLPETDVHEAAALAERLRLAIAAIRLDHAGEPVQVTASFGVAEREAHHHSLDALISSADKCLYQSKAMGRNRVSYDVVRQAS